MTVDPEKLDRALDKGALRDLPPNIPPGFMGEIQPDMYKADDFKPGLNAGVIQEGTWETRWLTIGLLYLLVLTSPVAVWLLWRDPKRSRRTKTIATAVGVAGYVAVWALTRR
jgi:hypothetical protein